MARTVRVSRPTRRATSLIARGVLCAFGDGLNDFFLVAIKHILLPHFLIRLLFERVHPVKTRFSEPGVRFVYRPLYPLGL